jgi:guanylate kinase
VLEQRLRARSEDSEEVIERRLGEAAEEIRNYGRYDYVLINRDLEQSVRRLRAVVEAERLRRNRMESQIQPVLATFGSSLTVGARGE